MGGGLSVSPVRPNPRTVPSPSQSPDMGRLKEDQKERLCRDRPRSSGETGSVTLGEGPSLALRL